MAQSSTQLFATSNRKFLGCWYKRNGGEVLFIWMNSVTCKHAHLRTSWMTLV